MAIIVNKEQKRRDIALSCRELLLEKGIKKLTVSEVAKVAGVSKGSIYDYFENKEDIVFEIIRSNIEEYQVELNDKIHPKLSTRDKVFLLFDFFLNDNEKFLKNQNIYREYMSINLGEENPNMSCFNNECADFFKDTLRLFIEEGIKKCELIEESLKLVNGFYAVEKGFLVTSWTENNDKRKELIEFLNTIFDLIQRKK